MYVAEQILGMFAECFTMCCGLNAPVVTAGHFLTLNFLEPDDE